MRDVIRWQEWIVNCSKGTTMATSAVPVSTRTFTIDQAHVEATFRVARLPGFIGGLVFAGAWLEHGDVFDEWQHAGFRSNGGAGVVVDTLFGPVLFGGSWSFDRRWRTHFAVGRLFR